MCVHRGGSVNSMQLKCDGMLKQLQSWIHGPCAAPKCPACSCICVSICVCEFFHCAHLALRRFTFSQRDGQDSYSAQEGFSWKISRFAFFAVVRTFYPDTCSRGSYHVDNTITGPPQGFVEAKFFLETTGTTATVVTRDSVTGTVLPWSGWFPHSLRLGATFQVLSGEFQPMQTYTLQIKWRSKRRLFHEGSPASAQFIRLDW